MNRIRELMERAGIQQKELAIAIGISQPTVSDWVQNKKNPSNENVQKLADYFHVSPLVVRGIESITQNDTHEMTDDDREIWEAREAARRDPERMKLFMLAKNGTAQDVRQANALVDALRATNPDFYDGDDPA